MEQAQSSPLPQVTFYTKAGCHLCDDAREMLDEIAAQVPYTLTEVDIRGESTVFERYRYRIPVILIAETVVAEGRIEYSQLLQAFNNYTPTIKTE